MDDRGDDDPSCIALVRPHAAIYSGLATETLLFMPASLLRTSFGLALYHRMSDIQFERAVNILLPVSGLILAA